MVISLIHPSRGRSNKAFITAKKWIENAGCKVDYVLSLDLDDSFLDDYNITGLRGDIPGSSTILKNSNSSVVEATNRAAKAATGDILIYLSDDFDCPPNWGLSVIKEFEGEDRPLLLKVHDNLQDFNARVLTIPIMNRSLYDKLGYFWFPEYKSMWVDCDLFETVTRIGAMKNARHLVFHHEHHSIGKAENDQTYKASEANWDQGLKVFNRRKQERFPI